MATELQSFPACMASMPSVQSSPVPVVPSLFFPLFVSSLLQGRQSRNHPCSLLLQSIVEIYLFVCCLHASVACVRPIQRPHRHPISMQWPAHSLLHAALALTGMKAMSDSPDISPECHHHLPCATGTAEALHMT
jgi:hypothetical protein